MWDVFISHAWEDKDTVARPIANALAKAGLKVWYDEFTLTLGDSLRRSIDRGLSESKYGIVILSPHFFAKSWPQRELDGLTAREVSSGKMILPVWHEVTQMDVEHFSPTLADKLGVPTTAGLDRVVQEILRVLRPESAQSLSASLDQASAKLIPRTRLRKSDAVRSKREAKRKSSSPPQDLGASGVGKTYQLLPDSIVIGRFHFGREKVTARVHEKYEPPYSDEIAAAFHELNEKKRSKDLIGYYAGPRFRPILPPVIDSQHLELTLTPLNYAFVALLKDEDVHLDTKKRVKEQIARIAARIPRSLSSQDPYFNAYNYNLLGIETCLVTSDGLALLRRRSRNVLTGRHRWDMSVSGHPTTDDIRGNEIDLVETIRRETYNEIGSINGDPRNILFIGLHRNKTYGDIDLLTVWPIDESANRVRHLITQKRPDERTEIFHTTEKAREAYIWDTDNLLVEFSGPAIVQALKEERINLTDVLPEALVCLELALLAKGRTPIGLNL